MSFIFCKVTQQRISFLILLFTVSKHHSSIAPYPTIALVRQHIITFPLIIIIPPLLPTQL